MEEEEGIDEEAEAAGKVVVGDTVVEVVEDRQEEEVPSAEVEELLLLNPNSIR